MTKQTLYAVAETAVSTAAVITILSGALLAQTPSQGPACATCVAISVIPSAAPALPGQLGAAEVFVRVMPGDEQAAASAHATIEQKGGRPGLHFERLPDAAPGADTLARARRILISIQPPAAGQNPDEFAFTLKTRMTAIRAAAADMVSMGLAARTSTLSLLLSRDVGSYVDFIVATDASALAGDRLELWRLIPGTVTSVDDALAVTRTAEVTHWLWSLPADATVSAALATELARRAALPAGADPSQPAATDRFGEGVEVVGSRSLSVDEIVARHQAAAARQAKAVQRVISEGTLTLSFEAPGFPAPITISSETTMFTSPGVTEIEQRAIRVNGIEFKGGSVPRLPIIEPERVASPPLAIALTDVYRYRLGGRETVAGTLCYVVAFEPDPARTDKSSALFRGQAWIAADTFAMLKVSAAQTGLRGPIVASEQVDEFRQAQPGVWLLARSEMKQMYEGAAHRTPIHRVLAIRSQQINPPEFDARRSTAQHADSVMLRDTPDGYRYLKKGAAPAADGSQAIAGRADRVRTLVAGVILDPNISIPLPFAGITYVDFNFLGKGTQLNAFFGGTYGQIAFSVPSLGGTRWQLAGRGFGIASSYNDRSFVEGRELYEDDIRQRPAQGSVWLLRPLSPRISLRVGYDLDYTHLAAGEATATAFAVPADQIVHGARFSLDVQRDGWNGSAWWNPARRSGWRAWGRATGEYRRHRGTS